MLGCLRVWAWASYHVHEGVLSPEDVPYFWNAPHLPVLSPLPERPRSRGVPAVCSPGQRRWHPAPAVPEPFRACRSPRSARAREQRTRTGRGLLPSDRPVAPPPHEAALPTRQRPRARRGARALGHVAFPAAE